MFHLSGRFLLDLSFLPTFFLAALAGSVSFVSAGFLLTFVADWFASDAGACSILPFLVIPFVADWFASDAGACSILPFLVIPFVADWFASDAGACSILPFLVIPFVADCFASNAGVCSILPFLVIPFVADCFVSNAGGGLVEIRVINRTSIKGQRIILVGNIISLKPRLPPWA